MAQLTCAVCGAPLPTGAMFCGECGRAVVPSALAPAVDPSTAVESAGAPETTTGTRGQAGPGRSDAVGSGPSRIPPSKRAEPTLIAPADASGRNLNTTGDLSAVFGGTGSTPDSIATADTTDLSEIRTDASAAHDSPFADDLPIAVGSPLGDDPLVADDSPRTEPASDARTDFQPACELCGASMDAHDIFCGECGHVSGTVSRAFGRRGGAGEAAIGRTNAEDTVHPRGDDGDELEATRIVAPRSSGDRFVLQFSTGESVTTHGSGLVGRNPIAEPGEYFDQLVRVIDPTRSVSKTHLEFGQNAGSFWVRDRYSGNGSVLREPDAAPRRCEPGKRYPVVRGTRIDIGEQFLILI